MMVFSFCLFFFFFNDTATTEIYTLSLHDALPISPREPETPRPWAGRPGGLGRLLGAGARFLSTRRARDRKSTRLNSSHSQISYAVFCLKKKKKKQTVTPHSEKCAAQHSRE